MNAMADVKVMKTAAETALAQTYAQAHASLPGGATIAQQRAAAFDLFAKEGLPPKCGAPAAGKTNSGPAQCSAAG